jgi:hypothetical protein
MSVRFTDQQLEDARDPLSCRQFVSPTSIPSLDSIANAFFFSYAGTNSCQFEHVPIAYRELETHSRSWSCSS